MFNEKLELFENLAVDTGSVYSNVAISSDRNELLERAFSHRTYLVFPMALTLG